MSRVGPWIGSHGLTEFKREAIKKCFRAGFGNLCIFAKVLGCDRHGGSDSEKGPMRQGRFNDLSAILSILFRRLQKNLRQLNIGSNPLAYPFDLFEQFQLFLLRRAQTVRYAPVN